MAVIVYAGTAAGCDKAGNGELTIYKDRLLVGTDASYPPFESVQDGVTTGFDIDIAGEIASRLDKEMVIVPITWDFSFKIPEDISLDMIISAVSAQDGKKESVDFSDPYYTLEYILVVPADAELTIKEDLKGKRIGIIDIRVKDLDPEYLKDYSIKQYKEVLVMMEDLGNKNIDAVLISVPVGKNIIDENSGLYRILDVVESNMAFNIVFRKGSPLTEEVNSILVEMTEDGTYQDIYDAWFSFHGN